MYDGEEGSIYDMTDSCRLGCSRYGLRDHGAIHKSTPVILLYRSKRGYYTLGGENVVRSTTFKVFFFALIISALWIIGWGSFLDIKLSVSQITIGNQTIVRQTYLFVFRDELFENFTMSSVLAPIIGASASVLAIVFAISNLVISNISERYSPYVLRLHEEEGPTKKTLYSFVVVVGFSVILLFLCRLIPPVISFTFFMLNLSGFVFALFLLLEYFSYMFRIINPLKFGDILKNRTLEVVERREDEEIRNYITSLGDVTVRAFDRKEIGICTFYINLLYDTFDGYMQLRSKDLPKYKSAYSPWQTGRDRNSVMTYVLDEYFRVFKYSVFAKEEIISNQIVQKLFDMSYKILHSKGNDDLFFQVFEGKHIVGARYNQFFKLAVENKDKSRFGLVRTMVELLQRAMLDEEKILDDNLEQLATWSLLRINQTIIDNDDFELFRDEVNSFSLAFVNIVPNEIQELICSHLYVDIPPILYMDKDFTTKLEKERLHITHLVRNESSKDFKKARNLRKSLENFEDFLVKGIQRLRDSSYVNSLVLKGGRIQSENVVKDIDVYIERITADIRGVIDYTYDLYVTSHICKTFFLIGAYLVFKEKKEGTMYSPRYIRELWSHTTPEDADSISLNRTPTTFDPFWLTCLLMYGGTGQDFRLDFFEFEDFHGITEYVNKYYLLSMVKKIQDLKAPSIKEFEDLKNASVIEELYFWYELSDNFSSQSFQESLLRYCDDLIEKAKVYESLLLSKNQNEETDAIETDAKMKLQNLRTWIGMKNKDLKQAKLEIVGLLPLDLKKVQESKKKISEEYNRTSKIVEMVGCIRPYQEGDRNLQFVRINQSPRLWKVPKDCLIEPSTVDCSVIWSDLGRRVAFGEMNYFIRRVSQLEDIERISLKVTNIEGLFEKVTLLIKKFKKKGFEADVICIPIEYFTQLTKEGHIVFEGKSEFLRVNKERISVVFSSKFVKFNDIFLFERKAFSWIYIPKNANLERLFVTIQEDEEDKSLIIAAGETEVSLTIENPGKAKMLILQPA